VVSVVSGVVPPNFPILPPSRPVFLHSNRFSVLGDLSYRWLVVDVLHSSFLARLAWFWPDGWPKAGLFFSNCFVLLLASVVGASGFGLSDFPN
jgi:hypothetical protein